MAEINYCIYSTLNYNGISVLDAHCIECESTKNESDNCMIKSIQEDISFFANCVGENRLEGLTIK